MADNFPEGSDPRGGYRERREGYPVPRRQREQPPTLYGPPRGQHVDARGPYDDPRARYDDPRARYDEPRAPYVEARDPYADPRGQYAPRPAPADYPRADAAPARTRSGAEHANTIANIIGVVTGLIALVFVLHIVFVVAGANHGNGFVSFVYQMSRVFVLGFGDVFTPNDAKIGVALNYGLAAALYLVVGQLINRALRNR